MRSKPASLPYMRILKALGSLEQRLSAQQMSL